MIMKKGVYLLLIMLIVSFGLAYAQPPSFHIFTGYIFCSDDLVTDGSNYNDINSEFIMSDASNYKFKNITNINLSINVAAQPFKRLIYFKV